MKDIAFFDSPAGATRQRKRSNLKSKHSNIRIWRRADKEWDTPTIEVVSPSGRVVEARHAPTIETIKRHRQLELTFLHLGY